jgi:nucleoside-diphosphate-sugar epimerase
MKKILITGASGFLGRTLLPLLCDLRNYSVYAVTSDRRRLEAALKRENLHIVEADLFSREQCARLFSEIKPEYLIHLAWDQRKETYRNDSSNLEWLTISIELLNRFAENGGKHMIFAGSSAEYEKNPGVMREHGSENTASLYGECKRAFAEVALNFGKKASVRTVSARYFTIYGEYDTHLFGAIPSAINSFLKNKPVVCRSPNTVRDYIYVRDAALATIALLESDYGGIVNIASGVPHLMRDVFMAIARKMDCWHLLSFENENEPGNILVADTSVLNDILGYRCRTSFSEGIDHAIEWWRKQA